MTHIVFGGVTIGCIGEETSVTFIRDSNFDGKIDDNNIIRITEDTRQINCARKCKNDDTCVGFYIDPALHRCQEQNMTSNITDVRSSPGWLYYYKNITKPEGSTCPFNDGGWSETSLLPDGLNYKFITSNQVNFNSTDAFDFCLFLGGTLPIIYTKEKMDFYLANIFTCPDVQGYSFWIDGTNFNAASNYFASDAFKTDAGVVIPQTSDLWASGRPNSPDTQHCVRSSDGFDYMFDDAHCDNINNQMLCEKQV
ncbi:Collectin-11 [Mactra antiquata]